MHERSTDILVFDHVPKCAGTTFGTILKKLYGQGFIGCSSSRPLTTMASHIQEAVTNHGPVAIAGHFAWGVQSMLPDNIRGRFVTILRHPLSLLLSTHNYGRVLMRHDTSIHDYLLHYPDNPLTDWFGGGDLDRALERLHSYDLVGLTERFEDTLALFALLRGVELQHYTRRNVSSRQHEALAPDIEAEFLQLQAKDMILYEYARQRMEKELAQRTTPLPRSGPVSELSSSQELERGASDGLSTPQAISQAKAVLQEGDKARSRALLHQAWQQGNDHYLEDIVPLIASFDLPEALRLLGEYIESLPPCDPDISDAWANLLRQKALFMLAELTLRQGDAETADRLHEQAFLTAPGHWQAVQRHAVHCRTRGRYEQALQLLEAHPCSRDTYTMFCEIAVTSFLAHGKEGMRSRVSRLRQQFAPHIRLRSQARTKAMGPDWQRIALEKLAAPRHILLFSSAPLALLCEAAEEIRMRFSDVRIEALAQPHVVAALESRVDVVHPLPAGMFVSAQARQIFQGGAFTHTYDTALLPMSSSSLDSYSEYLRFAQEHVEGRIVAYSLENLFRNEKRGWVRDVAPSVAALSEEVA